MQPRIVMIKRTTITTAHAINAMITVTEGPTLTAELELVSATVCVEVVLSLLLGETVVLVVVVLEKTVDEIFSVVELVVVLTVIMLVLCVEDGVVVEYAVVNVVVDVVIAGIEELVVEVADVA